jgi:hypothetical protein
MTIAREKPIKGCDSLLTPAPLRIFEIVGSEMIPIDVDLSEFKKIGESKYFEYYHKVL